MIKKHIITCTVIIALLVMAKVFAYNMPQANESLLNNDNSVASTTLKTTKTTEPVSLKTVYDFAEEALPVGDKKVARKMKKVLATHTYRNLQTNRLHRKAAEWFPIIEPILAAYGIPDDFKYVPLVESGLKDGVSPKGAAGYWQFMPATARMYGLKVNSKVDERNNLRKSTIAAAKYIKELHGIFDSWTMAAAAYNVGDGHMKKQIDRQKHANYFKMKLNKETAGYVYKLISMKEIMENPAGYGYKGSQSVLAYRADQDRNIE
jgi:membrane-bound lytic murein transglycosylase D